ncbi:hypothetical protein K1T71_000622 [Dendrolimus kikuchii]|uniref:Uncharacterized protein n=1 Tax=Dendrolimus kikuchii TaxID=765133 RepID=A0ACC1DJQ5_9NEOP|nr:hypothetical protein K1T71_000622 [Dendrolimus kikuchii]
MPKLSFRRRRAPPTRSWRSTIQRSTANQSSAPGGRSREIPTMHKLKDRQNPGIFGILQLGGTPYSPFGAAYTAGGVPPASYWYNTYPQQLGGFLQGVQGVQGYSYASQFAGYQQQYMGMGGVQLPWALGGVGGVGSVGGVAAMSQPPQVLHYPVQHFQVQPIGEEEWLAPSLLV